MRIAIVGGGISGTSAALHAVRKNYQVSLFEASKDIGGKVRSFFDSQSGENIDNGQHALMGAYTEFLNICNLLATYRYIYEPKKLSIAFASPGNPIATLEQKIFKGKYGTLLGLFDFQAIDKYSKYHIIKLFTKLMFLNINSLDTCFDFLNNQKQTKQAIKYFWEPLILAVMNASIYDAPASILITVMKQAFLGNSYESKLLLPNVAIDNLIKPIGEYLNARNGKLHLSEAVQSIEKSRDKFLIDTSKDNYEFDKVIISVPPRRIQKILLIKSKLQDQIDILSEQMEYSPIISAYLWYDQYVDIPEIVAMTDTKTQWIFNRSKIIKEEKGKYPFSLTCTISAASEIEKLSNNEIVNLMHSEISSCFPQMKLAKLENSKVIRERNATPLFTKSNIKLRPKNLTDIPGLVIAGDWTDTGLPATIEGAALSGRLAAESL